MTTTPLPRNAKTRKAIRNYEMVWRLWNNNLSIPEMMQALGVSRQRVYVLVKRATEAHEAGYFR